MITWVPRPGTLLMPSLPPTDLARSFMVSRPKRRLVSKVLSVKKPLPSSSMVIVAASLSFSIVIFPFVARACLTMLVKASWMMRINWIST